MIALKLLARSALVLLLLAPGLAPAEQTKETKAKKPRLAILDFPATHNAWACSGWGNNAARMSDVLRDLFTTAIMEKAHGKLRLVERERLRELREELKFQQSDEVDPASAQKAGKLLGARYVLTGKITRFACKVSDTSTGWGVGALVGKVTGSGLAGSVAGSVDVKRVNFSGRLDARLVEVETGEVLVAFKDENETGDTSAKVAGGGTSVQYDDELANKVFEPLVEKMASRVIKKTVQFSEEDED
ncbi:MAG TPA: CsgG/HfaB family protein [Anaeromyxobacteraceae bacterium]|nr:CsgG/HfaB family protein [Anaeromyxobacteraceae bacterium]